ncbi:hypothetical protein JZ751_017457 [Albula glossodonta]|uniref:Kinesin-like protein n=1 Tax=Albula glossodonta TaxID=121402 RepID=A0A8T2PMB3_9TELE|nr:hypothetical protein JZ751_017457 [Albula glossodonta]
MASESVKVVVRCRPMNDREKALNCKMVVSIEPSRCQCFIEKPGATEEPPKQFTFDGAYFIHQSTEQMYNEIAYPLVEGVTEGYNGTIFAYGQTGSGKSFSMQGVAEPAAQRGIIPRAFEHIFESIQLKEHPERGVYVRDLSMHTVHSVRECERIMEQGWKNRSVGYTLMNKDSSRSHSIFTIHLEICNTDVAGEDHLRAGKLNLVDLAGSERQSKTGATGERLREATKINLSLSALGNVISALVDGRSKHIPYRDSKLTRLLQDSLGGNTRTLMVACLSPADNNYEESLSTLRYANRAKSIQNRPRINEDPKDALLREYQEEIKQLRALISGQLGGVTLSCGYHWINLSAGPLKLFSFCLFYPLLHSISIHHSLAPQGIQSRPQSNTTLNSEAEKEKMMQEYEQKIARLQAEYNAEQESKARLQEDMVTLRTSYESKLSSLEGARPGWGHTLSSDGGIPRSATPPTEEPPRPGTAPPQEVTGVEQALAKVSQPLVACHVSSVQQDTAGEEQVDAPPIATPGPLDQKQVLQRLVAMVSEAPQEVTYHRGNHGPVVTALCQLQQLEQEFVGGEQARNEELRQKHRQRKTLADQRKKQLIEALADSSEDSDSVLLNVYDSIQEEVHAKSRLLENTQRKVRER